MNLIRALFLLLSAGSSAAQEGQYYAPGDAAWLGSSVPDPTPNYETYFPIIYVIYGPFGAPHVRAIVDEKDEDCPLPLHMHNATQFLDTHAPMKSLINGNPVNQNKMPYRFPVQVCGITINKDSIYRDAIENGTLVLSHHNVTYEGNIFYCYASNILIHYQ